MKRRYRIAIGAVVLTGCAGTALWIGARPVSEASSRPLLPPDADMTQRGAAAFVGAGFGGISQAALQRNAVPWRLTAAALVLEEQRRGPAARIDQATLRRVMMRFGFLYPAGLANLPKGVERPPSDMPLGITWGDIAPIGGTRVRVANLGCAACHAGVTYGADGAPRRDIAMIGMPNSSIDLEAYVQAVYVGLSRHAGSPHLMAAAEALFPDMDWQERASLRWMILPLVRHRLAALKGQGRAMPFPNGSPGSTNGVAALKLALGSPLLGGGPADRGVVSIPDLGGRAWRTSLLTDGAYRIPAVQPGQPTIAPMIDDAHLDALAAITSFFTVPSMGVHPDDARDGIKDARAIFDWLGSYHAQPFPGPVKRAAAQRGAAIYARTCASCHGDYGWRGDRPTLMRFPNWIGDVGTDALRAAVFDRSLAQAVDRTSYRATIAVRTGQGYAAPPLSGLWASAPYLHNGSVPTLAALLTPSMRPRRFMVGGHALDLTAVGLKLNVDGRYPAGYHPFSQPQWIDTQVAGLGNGGHVQGAELDLADKQALIEFLKLL
ncbi:c-type cytochrome [Sphingobium sp. AP49]|uniref:c-type cytochrome n=1 Tax=Sphingobium sp. AP49 TaxID=1144307 RepID=UPI00026ED998|nr:c-type cytochrome [Sphingobium sp. AP49]WHO39354.1 c-type cytochrome [Sphingobium sp. AP49]